MELGCSLLPGDTYITYPPNFKRTGHFRNKIQLTLQSGRTDTTDNKRGMCCICTWHLHEASPKGISGHSGVVVLPWLPGGFLFPQHHHFAQRVFRIPSKQAQLLGPQCPGRTLLSSQEGAVPLPFPLLTPKKEDSFQEGLLCLHGLKLKSRS